MFPMTITLHTQAQLTAVLAALAPSVEAEVAIPPTRRGRIKPEIRDPETSPDAAPSAEAPADRKSTRLNSSHT